MNLLKYFDKKINSLRSEPISNEEMKEFVAIVWEDINYRIAEKDVKGIAAVLALAAGPRLDAHGRNLILNGNDSGWRLIEQNAYCQGYMFQSQLKQGFHINSKSIAGILAMCVNWRYDNFAQACLKFGLKEFTDNPDRFKDQQQIQVFVAALAHRYYFNDFPEYTQLLPQDHVYQRVINAWDDEELLSSLFPEVCDAHIYATYDDGKRKTTDNFCFDFIPFDLQLLKLLRNKEKRPVPVIDHPLLKTLLADIPLERQDYDPVNDQILQAVLKHDDFVG